jgi:UPF0271 protein
MYKTVDINCDLGEGMGNEKDIMPYISSCNVACGGHFGDETSMRQVVKLAEKHKVKIGAHPSFPDKINFGRKKIEISHDELLESLESQVRSLVEILDEYSLKLNHIKVHGALYNLATVEQQYANIVAQLAMKFNVPVYAPYNSVMANETIMRGGKVIFEAFADRNYNDDMTLVTRSNENAVIHSSTELEIHLLKMINYNKVKTISGEHRPIKADTYCIHSDTKQSAILIKDMKNFLACAGISIK